MSKWLTLRMFLCLMYFLLLVGSPAGASTTKSKSSSQSSYHLKTSVIGAAGTSTSSANFRANGTLGQSTPIGIGSAADKDLYAGFWSAVWYEPATGLAVPVIYTNELFQNYPNPFNPTTTIQYEVGTKDHVSVTIYNVLGQQVRQLVNENKPPGRYTATWDGTNERGEAVATGVYFYRIRIGSYNAVKKMVLIK